jgi:hypothetical protein
LVSAPYISRAARSHANANRYKNGANRHELTRFGPPLLAAARYQWLHRGVNYNMSRALENENAVKIY